MKKNISLMSATLFLFFQSLMSNPSNHSSQIQSPLPSTSSYRTNKFGAHRYKSKPEAASVPESLNNSCAKTVAPHITAVQTENTPAPTKSHSLLAPSELSTNPLILTKSVKTKKSIRTLTLHNAITNDMATYKKHWSGNHTPEWKVLVNNQLIELDKNAILEAPNNTLEVEFTFDFYVLGKSYQKGSALATFEIPQPITHIDIEFSWDKPERLTLINKTPSTSEAQPLLLAYNEKK